NPFAVDGIPAHATRVRQEWESATSGEAVETKMEWPPAPSFGCHDCVHSRHNHRKPAFKLTALLSERKCAKGKKVPDHLFKEIRLSNHSGLSAWNRTIRPNR